jgi:hypothetical protein
MAYRRIYMIAALIGELLLLLSEAGFEPVTSAGPTVGHTLDGVRRHAHVTASASMPASGAAGSSQDFVESNRPEVDGRTARAH